MATLLPARVAGAPADGSFEFREGVVVDPRSGTAYLMNDRDGIDAIRLRDASAKWSVDAAQKPLLLSGHTLVAQSEPARAGRLRLALLDAGNGTVRRRAEVALPEEVVAGIDEGPGKRFEVHAAPASGGCDLDWTYTIRPIQVLRNVPPPDSAERRWHGRARLWFADGRTETIDTGEGGEPLPPSLVSDREADRLPGPVWTTRDAWLSAGRDGKGSHIVVERWRRSDGRALPPLQLDVDPGFTLRYPSADGRHLLLSRRVRGPDGRAEPRYEWIVYALDGGRAVARFEHDLPAAWFFIAGSLLIHEVQPVARVENGEWTLEPKKIMAIDLRNGSERWSVSLRNTAYRGLMPPGGPAVPGGMPDRPEPTPHPEGGEP